MHCARFVAFSFKYTRLISNKPFVSGYFCPGTVDLNLISSSRLSISQQVCTIFSCNIPHITESILDHLLFLSYLCIFSVFIVFLFVILDDVFHNDKDALLSELARDVL